MIEDSNTADRFNTDYLPTIPGTRGFIDQGTINRIYVDEKYVCSNGSQRRKDRAFSCVEHLQEFPQTENGKNRG